MNSSLTSLFPPRIGLRVFILLLAWVVVVSLSWADLLDCHPEIGGGLVDVQQATEPDLDEIRDDTATIWLVEERLTERFSIRPFPALSLRLSATDDVPLPPRTLLSKLSVYRL